MTPISAVICDFGGVLTSPLIESFAAFQADSGISLEQLGQAMFTVSQQLGVNPLFELETGRMTEAEFLDRLGTELSARLARPIEMHSFGEAYFGNLHPNESMIEYMRELRARGLKMAICTNNVREWEPLWRAKLPVDEIFEVVVDSGFVGVRKPDPEIYAITLERLGVTAAEALFVDDVDVNCDAARAAGMHAVHFVDTDQAITEIEELLAHSDPS